MVEVTERLFRVCGHLPPDDFAELVTRVVDVTMRYDDGASPSIAARWVNRESDVHQLAHKMRPAACHTSD